MKISSPALNIFAAGFRRMVQILFKIYALPAWLIWGFLLWIIQWNLWTGLHFGLDGPQVLPVAGRVYEKAAGFIQKAGHFDDSFLFHFALIAGIVLLALLLNTGILWLKSRCIFIFLDNLVLERVQINSSLARYRHSADSYFKATLCLFGFRIGLWFLLIIGRFHLPQPFLLTVGLVHFLLDMLVFCVLGNFVVPVMYRKNLGVLAAARIVLRLVPANAERFIVFLIFLLGLSLVPFVLLLAAAFLNLWLVIIFYYPVIGQILLMPYHVFRWLLGPEFLASIDPELNIFIKEENKNGNSLNA